MCKRTSLGQWRSAGFLLVRNRMKATRISWIALSLIAGCSGSGSNGDDTGSDGGSGGMRPGFTNGVSTLAGDAMAGYLDGSRDVNLFNNPVNVAYGSDGKVYVADFDNSKLRVVDADGTAATVIAQPNFSRPFGMVFAPDGTLYVSTDNDPNGNHSLMSGTVWKIDVQAKKATPVSVGIGRPRSLAVLSDGRLAAADDLHQVIEIIDPHSGMVTTLAGTLDAKGSADGRGAAARFSTPYGLVQRSDGKLVVCDFDNNKLRLVGLDGTVTTLAGSTAGFADGALSGAMFTHPQAIAQASNGDLFITDLGNNRVRKISGSSIETIAGDGMQGYRDDDDRLASELFGLEGLSVKPDGSMVYVADGTRGDPVTYNRVRQIKL